MKLSLLHKNVDISSHRKGNLVALTTVCQFEICPADYPNYQGRDHETWFELSNFSSYPSFTVYTNSEKRALSDTRCTNFLRNAEHNLTVTCTYRRALLSSENSP